MFKKIYQHKNILITGASSGLGKNLATNYAKNGARIINLSRDINKMKILNQKLNNLNNNENLYYSVDVSNYKQILEVKDVLKGKNIVPDVIINNAAGNFLCPFNKLSKNGWTRIIDIVLNGSFNIYHIFGNEIINQQKSAVFLNISTTYSSTGSALVIPSGAAKAGVDNMIKGLAVEWSRHNIRCVGIAPGPIGESGGKKKLDPFNIFELYNTFNNPSKRSAKQDEISNLSLFLTSEYSDYINGQIITIDGGETVKNAGEFNFITNIPFYSKLIKKI